jgi:hypothetical protein
MQLEKFEHPHLVAGRNDHVHEAGLVGQHDPRLADVEQPDAPIGQDRQQVSQIEILDPRIGIQAVLAASTLTRVRLELALEEIFGSTDRLEEDLAAHDVMGILDPDAET